MSKQLIIEGVGVVTQDVLERYVVILLKDVVKWAESGQWNQVAWAMRVTGASSLLPVYVAELKKAEDAANGEPLLTTAYERDLGREDPDTTWEFRQLIQES